MKKKSIIFIISLLLLTALTSSHVNALLMVGVPAWARDSVNFVVDNGYMSPNGTNTNGTPTFNSNSYITKADFVTVLYKHNGSPSITPTSIFTDVSTSASYAKAVTWAYYNGIAWRTSSTTFSPNQSVYREDAIRMIYNYASYCGLDVTYDTSMTLSNFSDASQVSSIALPAVKWAVYRGIIIGSTTGTATLTPRAYTTRAQTAQMIRNYGMTVEGLDFLNDTYSFTNSSSNFYSDDIEEYFIIDADLEHLRQKAVANNVIPSTWNAFVNEKIYREWKGSCYGMAVTTIFDKMGRLNVNDNRVNNADNLYQIGLPKDNLQIESMINYYQLLQCLVGFAIPTTDVNLGQMMKDIRDSVINEGMCIIEFHSIDMDDEGNHAVIAYDVNITSENIFEILVYDCNSESQIYTIYVNLTTSKPTIFYKYGSTGKGITLAGYLSWKDISTMYADFDLDGPYNNWDMGALAGQVGFLSADPIVGDDVSTLYVETDSDFVVVNSEGERLIYDYDTNSFSGDMELRRKAIAAHGADYDKLSYILTVEKSDEYTFISAGDETDCHVLTRTSYIGAKGTNIDRMVIAETGAIDLQGNAMEYDLVFNSGETEGITFKGIGTGELSVTKANEKVNVSGDVSVLSANVLSTGESAVEMCSFGAELTVVPPTIENNLLK